MLLHEEDKYATMVHGMTKELFLDMGVDRAYDLAIRAFMFIWHMASRNFNSEKV
jgi:hypothetical protein